MSTRRAAAAALMVAAASVLGPGLVASPAQADACAGAGGVTVVVDFNQLGGGVQVACDADGGGKSASTIFPESGFALRYATREPGFVCRVEEKPAEAPCVTASPGDAYWSLYWSDGDSGSWNYATTGAGGLTVPDGGYVAFSWQGQDARSEPSYDPVPRTADPEQPPGDTGGNAGPDGSGPGGGSDDDSPGPTPGSPSTAPGPSTDPTDGGRDPKQERDGDTAGGQDTTEKKSEGREKSKQRSEGADAGETSTDSGPSTVAGSDEGVADAPDATGSSQVPWWAVGLVFVGLAGALGVVAVRRRRHGT